MKDIIERLRAINPRTYEDSYIIAEAVEEIEKLRGAKATTPPRDDDTTSIMLNWHGIKILAKQHGQDPFDVMGWDPNGPARRSIQDGDLFALKVRSARLLHLDT